jgi:protein-S-isoprenylcysteine O-methyltransferase Ste14
MRELLRKTLLHYTIHTLVFGGFFALYSLHAYYQNFLQADTLLVLKFFFFSYLVLGLPYYLLRFHYFTSPAAYKKDKLVILGNFFRECFSYKKIHFTPEAKTVLLSYLVKFFFLPLMLNFFFGHFYSLLASWQSASLHQSFAKFFWDSGYQIIYQLIFLIDTAVFALAYAFEFRFLRNTIRSVDPFVSGWVVALICYPPFSGIADNFIPLNKVTAWITDGYLLDVSKILILLAFGVYVWATISLGFKASNLTNRGIVTSGPYRFIRHPAYVAKNLAWWLEFLPYLSVKLFLALIGWGVIYILRAFTEERHLSLDADYRVYKKQVKWRFIPRIY